MTNGFDRGVHSVSCARAPTAIQQPLQLVNGRRCLMRGWRGVTASIDAGARRRSLRIAIAIAAISSRLRFCIVHLQHCRSTTGPGEAGQQRQQYRGSPLKGGISGPTSWTCRASGRWRLEPVHDGARAGHYPVIAGQTSHVTNEGDDQHTAAHWAIIRRWSLVLPPRLCHDLECDRSTMMETVPLRWISRPEPTATRQSSPSDC